jgi:hypothetical protein
MMTAMTPSGPRRMTAAPEASPADRYMKAPEAELGTGGLGAADRRSEQHHTCSNEHGARTEQDASNRERAT